MPLSDPNRPKNDPNRRNSADFFPNRRNFRQKWPKRPKIEPKSANFLKNRQNLQNSIFKSFERNFHYSQLIFFCVKTTRRVLQLILLVFFSLLTPDWVIENYLMSLQVRNSIQISTQIFRQTNVTKSMSKAPQVVQIALAPLVACVPSTHIKIMTS